MTPGWSDHEACLSTTWSPYLNSSPEAPQNWGQIIQKLNDYHSDPMEVSSSLWIPDITDSWHQQKEMHSKFSILSNVAPDIVSILWHGVRPEGSVSLRWEIIGWRQSNTTGETLWGKVIIKQFAPANTVILTGDDPRLDTTNTWNNSEISNEAEESRLHRMAKVHALLEMWQGSHNLCDTQKESRA